MARLEGAGRVSGQAVGAATIETIIQLLTVANHRVALLGYGMGGAGTSNTEQPGIIDILRQSTAGTASALTLVKLQDTLTETLLTTGQEIFTVEPTPGDILRTHTLHPQAAFDIRDAFSREIIIGTAGRLAIRALYAQAQTLDAYMDFEE